MFTFKSYGIFDTDIEITESSSVREVAEQQRLGVELHSVVRLCVSKDRRTASSGNEVEYTEIHIPRQIHTYLIGIEAELLILKHMSDTSSYLDMCQDIKVPFHFQHIALYGQTGNELVVRHVIEVVIIAIVFAICGNRRRRGSSAIHIDRELRTYHEIESSPLSSHQQRDIEVYHMRQVAGFIDMEVHIKEIALCIDHRDHLVVILHTISVQLIHALYTYGEEEGIMIEPVVYTEIRIHAGRRRMTRYSMQQRRVSRIGMQRYEMVGLRSEPGMGIYPHAREHQTYYGYYLFHYYLPQINRFGRQSYKKNPTYTSFYYFFAIFSSFCYVFFTKSRKRLGD